MVSQHLRNVLPKFQRNPPYFDTLLIDVFDHSGHFHSHFCNFRMRNLHLLTFPTIYSLLCFPLKWRANESFSRRTREDTREGLGP